MDKMEKLNLRPHHGLCILLFTEDEHSQPYITIMQKLISELDENPQTEIILKTELDMICGSCSHNQNGGCEKSDEVDISDDKILEYCDLSYDISLTWAEFRHKLIESIVDKDLLRTACYGCMYIKYCEEQKCKKSLPNRT